MPTLRLLLDDIINDSEWDMTYLGMQIMVEGLALAAFGFMHELTEEPLLKKLLRYVMSDEARHVAFGVLSLQEVYEDMTTAEIEIVRSSRSRRRFACATGSSVRRCGSLWVSTAGRDRTAAQRTWSEVVPADAVLQDRAELQKARSARCR